MTRKTSILMTSILLSALVGCQSTPPAAKEELNPTPPTSEAGILSEYVQLTRGFARAGEAYFSPDAKWIAYASDESGRSEVYVQAFSEEGAPSERKWLISTEGGHWPKWRRDGKELLYLTPDRAIVAVDVTTGATFRHGSPKLLFAPGIRTPEARFDVTKDGRRFIIPIAFTEAGSEPARVIINWTSGIKP